MTTPSPGSPLGMSDFFVLEAGEYLERLDALLQAPEGTAPPPHEVLRPAPALPGTAPQPARARPVAARATRAATTARPRRLERPAAAPRPAGGHRARHRRVRPAGRAAP